MKKSELLKLLKKGGVRFLKEGKRHEIYFSPITGNQIAVPRHAKEIATGTVERILKDAGLKG